MDHRGDLELTLTQNQLHQWATIRIRENKQPTQLQLQCFLLQVSARDISEPSSGAMFSLEVLFYSKKVLPFVAGHIIILHCPMFSYAGEFFLISNSVFLRDSNFHGLTCSDLVSMIRRPMRINKEGRFTFSKLRCCTELVWLQPHRI